MQIVFFDNYDACFDALEGQTGRRLPGRRGAAALPIAQKSGSPQDFTLIPDYELPRTAGFGIKKDEPRFTRFVDQTLLDLEKSGEAEKIFDAWFAPVKRPFVIKED